MYPGAHRLWLRRILVLLLLGSLPVPGAQEPQPAIRPLHDLEELKVAFNRDQGKPRLVLLLSPT